MGAAPAPQTPFAAPPGSWLECARPAVGGGAGRGSRVTTASPTTSRGVIGAALAANLAIAVVKFAAFLVTRSSAMLSESGHSLVDCIDQVLLMIGQVRGRRPADERHPLGHGMEVYFWSFIVALMVFILGGGLAIVQGVARIMHPQPLFHPWFNFVVLALSGAIDGASFVIGFKAFKRISRGRVGLMQFLAVSKDPPLFMTLIEDGAALVGLVLAGAGIAATAYLGLAWADGAASIAIGLLLMACALFIANETRSLIVGEAAAPLVVEAIAAVLKGDPRVAVVTELITLHLGPDRIFVAAALQMPPALDRRAITAALAEICGKVRAADPRVGQVNLMLADARPSAPEAGPERGESA
jgi:cation diffusion facilitator family transporter